MTQLRNNSHILQSLVNSTGTMVYIMILMRSMWWNDLCGDQEEYASRVGVCTFHLPFSHLGLAQLFLMCAPALIGNQPAFAAPGCLYHHPNFGKLMSFHILKRRFFFFFDFVILVDEISKKECIKYCLNVHISLLSSFNRYPKL